LNEKLNYLLSESRLGLKLDSCFIPENSYNIILEQSLVEDLYAFLVDEKCLQKDDYTERDFKLLFNNSVYIRKQDVITTLTEWAGIGGKRGGRLLYNFKIDRSCEIKTDRRLKHRF